MSTRQDGCRWDSKESRMVPGMHGRAWSVSIGGSGENTDRRKLCVKKLGTCELEPQKEQCLSWCSGVE